MFNQDHREHGFYFIYLRILPLPQRCQLCYQFVKVSHKGWQSCVDHQRHKLVPSLPPTVSRRTFTIAELKRKINSGLIAQNIALLQAKKW